MGCSSAFAIIIHFHILLAEAFWLPLPRSSLVYVAPIVKFNFPLKIMHHKVVVHGQENFPSRSFESLSHSNRMGIEYILNQAASEYIISHPSPK